MWLWVKPAPSLATKRAHKPLSRTYVNYIGMTLNVIGMYPLKACYSVTFDLGVQPRANPQGYLKASLKCSSAGMVNL